MNECEYKVVYCCDGEYMPKDLFNFLKEEGYDLIDFGVDTSDQVWYIRKGKWTKENIKEMFESNVDFFEFWNNDKMIAILLKTSEGNTVE